MELEPTRTRPADGGTPTHAGDLLPEMRVILSSSANRVEVLRAALDSAVAERPIDWSVLVALSERERAAPVLARLFAAMSPAHPLLASDRATEFRRLGMLHEFRLSEMERQLDLLIRRFEDAAIPIVLLKGAALWKRGYGSPTDRPMGDCDMLVQPSDAERAWKAAQRAGWCGGVTGVPAETFDMHHHMDRMAGPGSHGLALEIHTDIVPPFSPFRFGAEQIWDRAQPLGGFTHVHLPAPEHLLLHNCLHFAWSHCVNFGAWRCFRDAHVILGRDDLDMDAFLRLARESRGGSSVFWTLYLARAWGGVEVDDAWLEAVGVPVPRAVMAPLRRHFGIRLARLRHQELPVRMERRLWELAFRPSLHGHGPSRPWSADDVWAEVQPGLRGLPRAEPSRLAPLARLGRTARYLAGLVAPR